MRPLNGAGHVTTGLNTQEQIDDDFLGEEADAKMRSVPNLTNVSS